MVEELVTALSRLGGLFVIARQSTFVYKGRTVDVRQVARELGVRYALEGSVRKAGPRVRITAQLVDAESGKHLWAERYDGALADVFDLQDRITESVVGAIEPSVQAAEIERARRKHPDNLDAYDLLLRALPHTHGHSPEEANQALSLLEQALDLDPSYATAHAYAAFCLEQRFVRGGFDPADREAAVRHAREALAKGRGDATALAIGGFVVGMVDRDAQGALTALDEAIALNPSSALAYGYSAVLRVFHGDFERGVEHAERAIRLSPLDPGRAHAWISIAYVHFFSGRYDEAVAAAQKSAHANPRFPVAQVLLAASRARLGQTAEARAAVARLLEIQPRATISSHERILTIIGVRAEWIAAVTAAMEDAGVPR
jgi:tetratricopeptide (TPR) repeat protein